MTACVPPGTRTATALILGSLLLAGCASSGSRLYAVQERTESECLVATDEAKCRISHDLSGGYPLNLGSGR